MLTLVDLGKDLQEGAKTGQAVAYGQVVLNILVGIDIGDRLAVTRLEALEKFDDLLLVVGHVWLLLRGCGLGCGFAVGTFEIYGPCYPWSPLEASISRITKL